ncbi:MAG: glycosyl hydrolase-related protein [Acidobacteriales bacterium]|nr:glycosyl hydrolase-related protein [Terriglobales bacterium]
MAEDGSGYVARFYEAEGRAADVAWTGPVKAAGAELCDMVERPAGVARVVDGQVQFRIEPWQIITIRVKP